MGPCLMFSLRLMTVGAGEEWLTVRHRTPLEYSRRAGHVSVKRA